MEKVLNFIIKQQLYLFLVYILLGIILYQIIKRIINKGKLKNKRQKTIKNLIMQIIKYTIIIIITILCLSLFGIDVTSFIAGLGIIGIVVGLALQDIMKDVLSGMFIIFENQFDVGDLVEIDGFCGEVIDLGIKTTKIKNYQGKIKIISNRNITEVINNSKSNSVAIIDIPVSYEENLENLDKIFKKITKRIDKEIEEAKDKSKLLGINNFFDSAIMYRISVEITPAEQINVERKIRKIIIEEFNKEKISIPYNKIEVINGNKNI